MTIKPHAPDTSAGRLSRLRPFKSVDSRQIAGLFMAIVALAVLMQVNFPVFLTPFNIEIMAVNFVSEAIIALGMTLVIITGGIDLSVAAVMPFAAILFGLALNGGIPIALAIVLVLAATAVVGFLNATMTNAFRVHPFIATLAMLLTLRGVNLVLTGGSTVSGFRQATAWLGRGQILGVPVSIVIFLVLAVLFAYLLRNQSFFRRAYFVGGNKHSARLSGINVERYLVFVYTTSAVLAGIAGILVASQYGAASNGYGQNLELRVITAVVIGGASLFGGTGSILGSVLGVVFLGMIYNAFDMLGVSTYWKDVVIGCLLLLAVFISEYLKRRQARA